MREDINNRLKKIIFERMKIDMDEVADEDKDYTFFHPMFGFSSTDMLYIFFDVEKEFDIKIPETDINENRFSSFNSIADIIEEQLTTK